MTNTSFRRALTRLAAPGVALLMIAGLSACGSEQPPASSAPPADTAIVVGSTLANTQPITARDPALVALAQSIVARHGRVTIVVADGAPRVTASFQAPPQADNDLLQQRQDARYVSAVVQGMTGARPKVAEADYPSALALGCRSVAEGGPGSSMIVLGSGLSTVTWRMQDGLLSDRIRVRSIVDRLEHNGAIPDLRGCPNIEWSGLGQTASLQEALTIAARKRLQSLTGEALARGGGRVRFVERPLLDGDSGTGLPSVTPVPISAVEPVVVSATFDDRTVGFIAGTAAFRDPPAARTALRSVAADILSSGARSVRVMGTTSSEGSGNVALSKHRAVAVCHELRELGVPASYLHADGAGSHFPGFRDDRNPDGSLNESIARQNRLVIIQATGH